MKLMALILILHLVLAQSACRKRGIDSPDEALPSARAAKIALSLPEGSERWRETGEVVSRALKRERYSVDMRFAEDLAAQFSQIEEMLNDGCDLLAVLPINAYAMGNVLEEAKQRGVPVVSCESLIMGTDAVSCFVAFDSAAAGRLQAQRFISELSLSSARRTFNIEIFPGDLEAEAESGVNYFNGLIAALEPYLDNNKVQIFSNQTSIEQMSVSEADPEAARRRMSDLVASCGYGTGKIPLDAIFCKNDVMARGAVQALVDVGYNKDDIPFVAGHGCDSENIVLMAQGLQTISLYNDADVFTEALVKAIDGLLGDGIFEPDADVDIGEGTVPAFFCTPVIYDAGDYATLRAKK